MTTEDVLDGMTQIPLFQNLPASNTRRLAQILRPLAVPPGTNLMLLEQPGETVYGIVSGTVRVQAEQADGALVILAFLSAGDLVGEMSLLGHASEPTSVSRSATVVAMEPCTLLWMDRQSFLASLDNMPRLSKNLLGILSQRLRHANERIQILATLNVAGRLARQLVAFAETYGQPAPGGGVLIPLRLTQSDLKDIVGASRERVNQVMGDMKRNDLLSVDSGHHITLHDPETLLRRYG